MGVSIEKDCIELPDGSLLCLDKARCKLYLFTKEEVSPDKLSDSTLAELMKKTLKQ